MSLQECIFKNVTFGEFIFDRMTIKVEIFLLSVITPLSDLDRESHQ